jgi:hypothetical protein
MREGGQAGALLVASAPLCAALPFATHVGWLGPIAAGTCAWLYLRLRHEAPRLRVVGVLLAWAAMLSASFIVLTALRPELAGEVIPRGPAYWDEMRPWLFTGEGKEASPARFVPEHLLHVSAFVVLAAISGGWLGLILGAFLMGYMSYYIGQVVLLADAALPAAILAWHPWAVLRVVAFVGLGVSFARLLLVRPGVRTWLREEWGFLLASGALWLCDLTMKAALAPHWAGFIRYASGID